jgi:hypothetical protein
MTLRRDEAMGMEKQNLAGRSILLVEDEISVAVIDLSQSTARETTLPALGKTGFLTGWCAKWLIEVLFIELSPTLPWCESPSPSWQKPAPEHQEGDFWRGSRLVEAAGGRSMQ